MYMEITWGTATSRLKEGKLKRKIKIIILWDVMDFECFPVAASVAMRVSGCDKILRELEKTVRR